VSNFQIEHLEQLAAETDTVPAVNQIEVHPYFTNDAVRGYGQEHGIATEAWSPIAQGKVLDDPTIHRWPTRSARRRRRSCCGGTSSAATSYSRSR
jgi:2,5-diketo-D-gluconate reductase A